MKTSMLRGVVPAFVLALIVATAWGSVVQTQYNLAGIASIGADAGSVRLQTTARDLFSGFFPTYGGYVVLPALLVAFVAAAWVARHFRLGWMPQVGLYKLAGFVAVFLAIPLVNWLSPVALLVGATRDWSCTFFMALGGVVAGLLFAVLTYRQPPVEGGSRHARRSTAPAA